MVSKWFELKPKAIALRRKGHSLKSVSRELGIPSATLSGWFRDVVLSKKQKTVLRNNWKNGLRKARVGAVRWHNEQKQNRLLVAKNQAMETLSLLDISNETLMELALAILYLGEGSKKNVGTSMGNSDPLILKFFIAMLKKIYSIDIEKIRCELHLRADQDTKEMRAYWSTELGIPIKNFTSSSIDKRTRGSVTYPYYKGVCLVHCGTVAIQRKLVYLSRMFCERVVEHMRG